MGSFNYFMHCPHTKQCTAVDKYLRHQEILNLKKSWERRESNPGRLGVKRERYLSILCRPPIVKTRFASQHLVSLPGLNPYQYVPAHSPPHMFHQQMAHQMPPRPRPEGNFYRRKKNATGSINAKYQPLSLLRKFRFA